MESCRDPAPPKRTQVMGSISADGSRNFEMVSVVPQS